MSLPSGLIEGRLRLKRIYKAPLLTDGKRILVDRLWPRGISKEKAELFLWAKDVAPSSELRRWFHKDIARWPEFRFRYLAELDQNTSIRTIQDIVRNDVVTLVFASADLERNHAAVLRDFLVERGEDLLVSTNYQGDGGDT